MAIRSLFVLMCLAVCMRGTAASKCFLNGEWRIENGESVIQNITNDSHSYHQGVYDSTLVNKLRFRNLLTQQLRFSTNATTVRTLDAFPTQFSIVHSSPDSPVVELDTAKKHSPQRAALFSAVVPGLGQVYNKQYWKVPVIYAGGAVAGYLIYYNYSVYKNLRKSFRLRKFDEPEKRYERFTVKTIGEDLDVNLENFTDGEILGLQQSYRRDLDLAVLLGFGVYALNVVDAVVFAHLYDFDVSDDLTLRLKPEFHHVHNGLVQNNGGGVTPTMQLGLTYRF